MYYNFPKLARGALKTLCLAVTCIGLATACSDDYDLDDEGNYPSWLGGSVYETLQEADQSMLTGTFTYYLRLIDDLGYTETLNRTGSKTVFVANDEAFERFFQDNTWGVASYEDLSVSQKKLLLYSSMLDNAILTELLSNVENGNDETSVSKGIAMKHATAVSVIDSITTVYSPDSKGIIPENNSYWDKYRSRGINLVMDGTRPMMVHFTQEQMTANNITTLGAESDFSIITGSEYNEEESPVYVFRDKIINKDITCKNGYIQQLEDVLVPPGNLAELIRTNGESNLFSRMLDRFSTPFYDATTTNNYNDWAEQNGAAMIDSIFEKRYFSSRSQGSTFTTDNNKNTFAYPLSYDPGWNEYTNGESGSNELADIAAMFVPTDAAMKEYFLPGGAGDFLIERYGVAENTEANLQQNVDSIPLSIVQAFIDNLMQPSFIASVPSKFDNVMDDASDPMGITTDCINKNTDGTYDVKIANNGVAYMLNKVFAPNRYVAVSAPALLNEDMKIMNVAINDGNGSTPLGYSINFYAYLLAMSANFGLFIPTDEAFGNGSDWKANGQYYIDPTYLGRNQPRALRFYYTSKSPYIYCSAWKYDPTTNTVGDSIGTVSTSDFQTQLTDILNYHTVVLSDGETMGQNKYYKTKHGGTIMFNVNMNGDELASGEVKSGAQIDNGVPTSQITRLYNQNNGKTYAIDHIIQAPQKSVYSVLNDSITNPQFTEFMKMCNYLDMDVCMDFASDMFAQKNEVTKKARHDAYHPFASLRGLTDNVNYFNSYNYTVFAPNNEAMQKAYDEGLPKWEDIYALYEKYNREDSPEDKGTQQYQADRDKALAMVEEINSFIRYHFMDNSIYADYSIETGENSTACADTLGVKSKLTIQQNSPNTLTVVDLHGNSITVNADGSTGMVNQMTRDYVFNTQAISASKINTSSFAVIHEISTPLSVHASGERYDNLWRASAKKLAQHRKQFETKLYKLY